MVTTRNPFLNDADVAALRQTYADGMATVQKWTHGPVVTFVRQTGASVGPVETISIRLNDRQATVTGAGQPVATVERQGTVKVFADQLPGGIGAVIEGDRFVWNDMPCIVQAEPMEPIKDSGVIHISFIIEDRS